MRVVPSRGDGSPAVAVSPVGAPGASGCIALPPTSSDQSPSPTALRAATR